MNQAKILELRDSGYLGVLSSGQLVDTREHPTAIPLQQNSALGCPKPAKNNDDGDRP